VDHNRYDTTSILALIEHRWGLAPLTARDAASFDKAYVEAQYEALRELAGLFRAYATGGDDARIRQFAQGLLLTVRSHLDDGQTPEADNAFLAVAKNRRPAAESFLNPVNGCDRDVDCRYGPPGRQLPVPADGNALVFRVELRLGATHRLGELQNLARGSHALFVAAERRAPIRRSRVSTPSRQDALIASGRPMTSLPSIRMLGDG